MAKAKTAVFQVWLAWLIDLVLHLDPIPAGKGEGKGQGRMANGII